MKKILFMVWVLVFLMNAALLQAAPKAELWEYWKQHNPASQKVIDHSFWDGFLNKYLVTGRKGVNLVKYAQVSGKDRKDLNNYLLNLQRVVVTELSRQEQLPYWINLYNALTVDLILEYYPVDSIRDIDISPGLFSIGPWDKKLLTIEQHELSLNDIEHRILRPIWLEPRIHYAVNCASIGCPNLRKSAFTAQNTELLMKKGARDYVNHPRGVLIKNSQLIVSSIYDWFQNDFGGSERGVISHLEKYGDSRLKNKLQKFQEIDDYHYDWSLNEAGQRQ